MGSRILSRITKIFHTKGEADPDATSSRPERETEAVPGQEQPRQADAGSISLSIYGMCVSRDVFGVHEQNGGYQIERFVQAISPISAVQPTIASHHLSAEEPAIQAAMEGLSNFYKKMLLVDLNRELFDYLGEVKSDWLILDPGALRYDLLQYHDAASGTDSYIGCAFEPNIINIQKTGGVPQPLQKISLSELSDEEFLGYMNSFADRMLTLYREDTIIINCCTAVPFTTDGQTIGTFDYAMVSKIQHNIARGERFFRERFPAAHVIEFPHGVLGNSRHKWGRYYLHYVQEYYDYALKAVDIITKENRPLMEERGRLASLKEEYETNLRETYEPIFVSSVQYLWGRDNLCTRMSKYESYMKELLLDPEGLSGIKSFFSSGKYGHCAFYGATELCKLFLPYLADWNVTVDYIVEDLKDKELNGIPIVPRQAKEYPLTQLMIIADVLNTEKIRQKLTDRSITYPVLDVYELKNGRSTLRHGSAV